MTTATLTHWMKAGLERIYINTAGGESVGYFQVAQNFSREQLNRRNAMTPAAEITWNGEDGLASAILDATFGVDTLPGITSKQGWREVRSENPDLLALALRQVALKKTAITI